MKCSGIVLVVLLSACGVEEASERPGSSSGKADSFEGENSPVVGLDIGQWATNWRSPSGVRYGWYWDVNVWIDLAVLQGQANDVGVRYRVNDGEYAEAYTSHESDLENAWQKWGVDIVPAATMQDCYWCESEPFNLEYEVFYTDSFGQYRTLGETFTYPLETEYPEGG